MHGKLQVAIPTDDMEVLKFLAFMSERASPYGNSSLDEQSGAYITRFRARIIGDSIGFLKYYGFVERCGNGYVPSPLGKAYLSRN